MGIIIGSSLLAAFLAGVAALLAPCCITVLLPSFFASIFREKRKVFIMTFIFFLGIFLVFLPLGLGFSAVGQAFSRYHYGIFTVGGIFFLLLGLMLLSGKRFPMPFSVNPTLKRYNALSVFTLGIFSGIATTCCAPVLAGVLALSVLPGSVVWGLVYTLSYVLGMVIPLFVIAFFLDKVDLTDKFVNAGRTRQIKIIGRTLNVKLADVISGLTFLAMGLLTLFFARETDVGGGSLFQVKINLFVAKLTEYINMVTGNIPQVVWALFFVGIFLGLAGMAIKQIKSDKK